MYLIYSLFFTLGLILTSPYYLFRAARTGTLRHLRERFGLFPAGMQQKTRGALLIHGVSLGETLALIPLVRELLARYPQRRIFISHATATGRAVGREHLPRIAGQFYLPLDWRWAHRRLMRHLKPDLVIVGETEIWPNFFRSVRESGAKLVIVNARLSDRSFPRYRLMRSFFHRVLADVDYVFTQSEADRKRFVDLGSEPGRVLVTGNTKFELAPPPAGSFSGWLRERLRKSGIHPVLFAASTMPGEEEKVIRMWRTLRRHHRRGLLVLAPRRPERFDSVARLLESQGLRFARRSRLDESADWMQMEALLLDSIGELANLFELCDLAFVGGSLVPTGGHNLLEPAFWAKPVLFGPHMENFREVANLFVKAGGAIQVNSEQALAQEALRLMADRNRASAMGGTARRLVEEHQGATARNLSHIRALLESPASELPRAPQSS